MGRVAKLSEDDIKNNLKIIDEFYDYMCRPPRLSEALKLGFKPRATLNVMNCEYLQFLSSNYYLPSDSKSLKCKKYAYRAFNADTGHEFIGAVSEVAEEICSKKATIEYASETGELINGYIIERRDLKSFMKMKGDKEHEQEQKTKQEAE